MDRNGQMCTLIDSSINVCNFDNNLAIKIMELSTKLLHQFIMATYQIKLIHPIKAYTLS